jgi:hypothetical protein
MPATTKPKSIYTKLAEVMGLMDETIAKKGVNAAQHYSFVNESDVSAAIRPLLAARGIWLWSSEVSQDMNPLFETSSKNTMWMNRLTMEYQFIDGETGERTDKQIYSGQGADIGDKGLPKAISMNLKYFLLKSFMLSTGKDDAESDERVDKAAAGAAAGAGSRVKGGKAKAGTQRGGKSDAPTKAQKDEIKRLIKSKEMTPVTLLIAVSESIDVDLSPGADPKDVLAALSSEEMGKLIKYISEMVDVVDDPVEEVGTSQDEGGEEAAQEGLSIV